MFSKHISIRSVVLALLSVLVLTGCPLSFFTASDFGLANPADSDPNLTGCWDVDVYSDPDRDGIHVFGNTATMEFTADGRIAASELNYTMRGKYRVDSSTNPPRINFGFSAMDNATPQQLALFNLLAAGNEVWGLYEIDTNELRFGYNPTGEARPTSIDGGVTYFEGGPCSSKSIDEPEPDSDQLGSFFESLLAQE